MAAAAPGIQWQPFIGRALGYLCLHLADMRSKTVLEQAEFLMALGMPRRGGSCRSRVDGRIAPCDGLQKAKKIAAKGDK